MNGRANFTGSPYLDSCRKNIYSQFGEDGIVDAILTATDDGSRWAFECGAADGIMFSNTRRLLDRGWRVCMIEADAKYGDPLGKLVSRYPNLRVNIMRMETSDIDVVFRGIGAPEEPAIVCIDIDGQDWHAWNRMIRYFPRIVVIEHSFHSAWIDRVPDIDEPLPAQAGPKAIARLAASKGYEVAAQTLTNSICVRSDLAAGLRMAEAKWYDERVKSLGEKP